jgi:hypothetical protein
LTTLRVNFNIYPLKKKRETHLSRWRRYAIKSVRKIGSCKSAPDDKLTISENKKMKKVLLYTICFLSVFVLFSCEKDVDTATAGKVINVAAPGTLHHLLTTTESATVTNLTLTGFIDARDFRFMRDSLKVLSVLDISKVNIAGYLEKVGTSIIMYDPYAIPTFAFYNSSTYKGKTSITSIALPTHVTSIGQYAFNGCSGLTSISIPSSVASIGNWAFSGCSGLTAVSIPSSVTLIGDMAFSDCSGLTAISISSSVTSIGSYAFHGCISLTSVSIPSSVTSIEDMTFFGCSGLTSIFIPASITSIGSCAFWNCSGLTSIFIPASVTSIGDWAFYGCSGLTSIYSYSKTPVNLSSTSFVFSFVNTATCILHIPVGSKAAYQAAGWQDFKNIVEDL